MWEALARSKALQRRIWHSQSHHGPHGAEAPSHEPLCDNGSNPLRLPWGSFGWTATCTRGRTLESPTLVVGMVRMPSGMGAPKPNDPHGERGGFPRTGRPEVAGEPNDPHGKRGGLTQAGSWAQCPQKIAWSLTMNGSMICSILTLGCETRSEFVITFNSAPRS